MTRILVQRSMLGQAKCQGGGRTDVWAKALATSGLNATWHFQADDGGDTAIGKLNQLARLAMRLSP